ncbi:class I SAM-dependent methyltransferase [Variovorax sp. 375MFSha3.1]|uniref:class I SAM-dependent methyltransferase n=1 Tax=Variovorax sp. 375MFSha3.1 TaxID=3158364 RepID=UPI003AAC1CE0
MSPADERPSWAADFFAVPLVDLGEGDPKLKGISTPEPEVGAEKIGISEQFLAGAEIYDTRYTHSSYMVELLTRAFAAVGFRPSGSLDVLDMGSGSGKNSLLPLLQITPQARAIATDLSPDLLEILQRYTVKEGLTDSIACVCTDAMNSHFRPGKFDLVMGIAILHHLIDPLQAIKAAHAALKPGGLAVFFDPFEGFGLISMAFRTILERADRDRLELNPTAAKFMQAMITDLDARKGTDKTADRFRYMDDKWLFTRTYFEDAAAEAGFRSVKVIARNTSDTSTREYVTDLFRLGCQLEPDALPPWAWEPIDLMDQTFSTEMKADLVMEGVIVLSK